MTAVVTVNSPKTQTRRIREEAMVVRSINFPVPISALITGSLGQIMPNGGDVSLLKVARSGRHFRPNGRSDRTLN
jgi:hypothetical protein